MTEVVETPLENRNAAVIVDQKQLPNILARKIQEGNQQLEQVRQEIQNDIEQSTLEIMSLMGISREDGWFLDLDGMRFVQIAEEEIPEEEAPEIDVLEDAEPEDDPDIDS